jgi:hypothetical protein
MGGNISAEVFRPPSPPKYDKEKEGLQWLPVEERRIPFICYSGGGGGENAFHMLYCKGGTEDIGVMDKWLRIVACTLHVDVWSFDYCGFGLHEGIASERHCYEDAEAIIK